jgi:S1-C subfamily serine protease
LRWKNIYIPWSFHWIKIATMNRNQLRIILGFTIVILLISQYVTNGILGIVSAFSSVQERHVRLLSLVDSSAIQLAGQSHLLPLAHSTIRDSDIHYISLANLTTSSLLTDIFKRVENSVVQITSTVNDTSDLQIIINGNPLQGESTRLGSGFVYDNQGHIVTNNHVVNGAKTVDVTFVDGNTYKARVMGTDSSSDLAVLQITDNFSAEQVLPLVITNSSSLQVGQQVIAIGNPFGLSDTMTTGIVSQTGRLLPNPDTRFGIPNGIQTDAAINPGNSGGPLLNLQGQVVGMNTAISSSTGEFSGIGFAVPSNAIARILPALIQNGSYTHPWLGISGGSITPAVARSAGLPINFRGVLVASVQTGSPAEKAGLHALSQDLNSKPIGDIIVAVDGHKVKRIDDIINYMETQKSVGQTVKLTVIRNGQTMDLTATLQPRPSSLPAPTVPLQ